MSVCVPVPLIFIVISLFNESVFIWEIEEINIIINILNLRKLIFVYLLSAKNNLDLNSLFDIVLNSELFLLSSSVFNFSFRVSLFVKLIIFISLFKLQHLCPILNLMLL